MQKCSRLEIKKSLRDCGVRNEKHACYYFGTDYENVKS
jgi:hypothetical protein